MNEFPAIMECFIRMVREGSVVDETWMMALIGGAELTKQALALKRPVMRGTWGASKPHSKG